MCFGGGHSRNGEQCVHRHPSQGTAVHSRDPGLFCVPGVSGRRQRQEGTRLAGKLGPLYVHANEKMPVNAES